MDQAAFWGKVEKSEGCWLWRGNLSDRAYGRFSVGGGRWRLAHRVMWELTNGPIPAGLFLCHRCDTPACVNPAHLFLGTHADNMADRGAKGRQLKGERHHKARLTAAQVAEIRARYGEGNPPRRQKAGTGTVSVRDLAKEYGVHPSTVHRIVARDGWE